MSFKLPESLYSVDQLQLCSDELRQYTEALDQGRHQRAVGAKTAKIVLPDLSAASYDLLEALPKSHRMDAKVVSGICDILDNWLETAPVINVTLPAPATQEPAHRASQLVPGQHWAANCTVVPCQSGHCGWNGAADNQQGA